MRIQLNYKDKQKPRGVVGSNKVKLHSTFSFFSLDGKLEVQFLNDSPVAQDHPGKKHLHDTDLVASKPGTYKFQCFLDGELLPDGGGEILIPDGGLDA